MPAPTRSRSRRWLAAAGIALVLLVGAIAAVPLLLDSDLTRRAVERQVSALAGGDVHYESISLRLYPLPQVEFRGVSIRIPGAAEGRIAAMQARIALIPLLAGKVSVSAIRIDEPVLVVSIAAGGSDDPFQAYRAALGPVVEALTRDARGVTLSVANGRVDVVRDGAKLVSLTGLSASANVTAEAVEASASCAADLWTNAQASARITAGSLAASAKMQVSGLHGQPLLDRFITGAPIAIRPGEIDASLDAETDGRSTLRVALGASTAQFAVARRADEAWVEMGAARFTAQASADGQGASLSLQSLQLGDLLAAATGSLRVGAGGAAPAVELNIPALDVARLRDLVLALGKDQHAVREASAAINAGMLRDVAIAASGPDFGTLANPAAIRAQARFDAGALAWPAHRIEVRNASGRIDFARGALRAGALAGEIGHSSFRSGTIELEHRRGMTLRKLTATLDADLAEALALSLRLLDEPGRRALADIESLSGRATGVVRYESGSKSGGVSVDVAKIQASGRYRGFPFPLQVTSGAVSYSGDQLLVRSLTGSAGGSQLRGGTLDLALGATPAIRSASADALLVTDELYPWLASQQGMRASLADLKSITGTATARLTRLSGPLASPASLEYDAVIAPQQLVLASPLLPGPLTLSSGGIAINARALTLDKLAMSVVDARTIASGTIPDYASSNRRIELGFANAMLGPQGIEWVRGHLDLPEKYMRHEPVELPSLRVVWPGSGRWPVLVEGKAAFGDTASASFDLAWQPGNLEVRQLVFKDPYSDFTSTVAWKQRGLDFSFNGHFDNRTLKRILLKPPQRQGAIRGNFQATIDLRDLRRSSASGALSGEGLDFFELWEVPLAIDLFRLDASGDALRVLESRLKFAGEDLTLSGTVERTPKTFVVDATVVAGDIDVPHLMSALPRQRGAPAKPAGPAGSWDIPVEGRIALTANSVRWNDHVFRQVAGAATLSPDRIVAHVREARLCGVAIPLDATLTPGNVSVQGRIQARKQPLAETLPCLAGKHYELTGVFDLDAEYSASGPAATLERTMRGSLRALARDGSVQHATAVTRILKVDGVSTRLDKQPSELTARGLRFSEITIEGTFDAGKARVERVTMDSPAVGIALSGEVDLYTGQMSLRGLAAPFGNIATIVKRVPLVGRVFGTHIVGIPISLTGDIRDPEVVPLGPAAVGQNIVNLMGAVIKAPIDLIDPNAAPLR